MKFNILSSAIALSIASPAFGQQTVPTPVITAASGPLGRLTLPDSSRPAQPNIPLGGVTNMPPTTAFFVNEKALMTPNIGKNYYSIALSYGYSGEGYPPPAGGGPGDFRTGCDINRMGRFDPLVHPGQAESGHLHTFFGNGSLFGTLDEVTLGNLSTFGTSTCHGGIANRSAYWVPTMIDTTTGIPVAPQQVRVYYKNSVGGSRNVNFLKVVPPPPGLRMIAGNPNSSGAQYEINYTCEGSTKSGSQVGDGTKHIPTTQELTDDPQVCDGADRTLTMQVNFPECWDGVNLDSPGHQAHMARQDAGVPGGGCPKTHPVMIPEITYKVDYWYPVGGRMKIGKWRLSSDNYSLSIPAGYGGHGDWINGWDQVIMQSIVRNCLQAGTDCHSDLIDGSTPPGVPRRLLQ